MVEPQAGAATEAYCFKCKAKRTMTEPSAVFLKNGKEATQGKCSVCGSVLTRFGRTPAHEGMVAPEIVRTRKPAAKRAVAAKRPSGAAGQAGAAGDAYCFKCGTKRTLSNPQAVFLKNGTEATQGKCPVCGSVLTRFGRTPSHDRMAAPETVHATKPTARRAVAAKPSSSSAGQAGAVGDAYCFKCGTKRTLSDPQAVFLKNGTEATQGKCPVCGSVLTRFGRTPAHGGMVAPETVHATKPTAKRAVAAKRTPSVAAKPGGSPDEAFCFKCHAKRTMSEPQAVFLKNGKEATQGKCPVCGGTLTRFGRSSAHEGMVAPEVVREPKARASAAAGLKPAAPSKRASPAETGPVSGKLVIVESPAKARTVGRFLGGGYRVKASIGHIRDLPSNRMGVDIENGFVPRYVIPEKKAAVVKELRQDATRAAEIYLATDPDREGEAISWHLKAALDKAIAGKPVHRVVFHEITREAVADAFTHARDIDLPLVDAQQTRRILDRVVGFSLSPLLRRKLSSKGYSAGRVQSVAVRMVVDREREIQAFVPVEYWSIEAELEKEATPRGTPPTFRANLVEVAGIKFECQTGDRALALKADLERCAYAVKDVRKKEQRRNPSPPFTTSTMQQEASRKLGFTAKRTMAVAQQLYEGLPIGAEGTVGLITYMRTDSLNVAESAQKEARDYIGKRFGGEYVPHAPRVYKTRAKGAQEAHEAIRPTSVMREPAAIKAHLTSEQFRLYDLIWKRFLASQMESAVLDTTAVDIAADRSALPALAPHPAYLFRANGSVIKFLGFMQVYVESTDEPTEEEEARRLPPLAASDPLRLLGLYPEQHFTQPPPRFTEASLVKAMEERGIGRPSTYAPTLATIQDRGYVQRIEGRRLIPTDIGFLVNDLLVKHFPDILDPGFTAQMEETLDGIASGERTWLPVMEAFWAPFKHALDRAETDMEQVEIPVETTDQVCDKCGRPMVVKRGRFGKFIACSGFPECRNTKPLAAPSGAHCPQCGGNLVERRTKKGGRIFYSCDKYPACKFALWKKPRPEPCPSCGGLLVELDRAGKRLSCQKCGTEHPLEALAAAAKSVGQGA